MRRIAWLLILLVGAVGVGDAQTRTLNAHRPELLSALEAAKDRSLTDAELVQTLPMFR